MDNFKNSIDNFNILKYIQKGRFGKVYLATSPKYKDKVAIKILDKTMLRENYVPPLTEIKILEKLDNPYIVRFYEHFQDEDSIYHVFKYEQRGDLYNIIENEPLGEITSLKYLKQLARGVDYLHSNNIMHRDIKPENILIGQDNLKLTDFGHAITFRKGDVFTKIMGTLYYLAPEMFLRNLYDERIDIWMLGIVYYEMLTSEPPFPGDTDKEVVDNIMKGKYRIPRNFTDSTKDNITYILQANPYNRATLSDILQF